MPTTITLFSNNFAKPLWNEIESERTTETYLVQREVIKYGCVGQKSWNMIGFKRKSWNMIGFKRKSWNMIDFKRESWNMIGFKRGDQIILV